MQADACIDNVVPPRELDGPHGGLDGRADRDDGADARLSGTLDKCRHLIVIELVQVSMGVAEQGGLGRERSLPL